MARRPSWWNEPKYARQFSPWNDDLDFEKFVAKVLYAKGIMISDDHERGGTYDYETTCGLIDAKWSSDWDGSGSVEKFEDLDRYVNDRVWFITNSLRLISAYEVRECCRKEPITWAFETSRLEVAFLGKEHIDDWIRRMETIRGR